MLKKFVLGAAFLSVASFSHVEANDILLEAKGAYFYPLNSTTRDIYSGAGVFGLELSVETFWGLYPWISAEYLSVGGHSIGEETKTRLRLIPLSIGLKYLFGCGCWRPYVGLGFAATHIHTKDDSPYVIKNRSAWGYGGIAKVGSYIYFSDCWFLDVFVDYTYMKKSFSGSSDPFVLGRTADLSNISVGGAIGVNF